MSWNFLSRSTSGLLDWVDRLGPNVTLDKRTLANTRTGWLLSQNTLRKARAARSQIAAPARMDLQSRRRRAGADHCAAPPRVNDFDHRGGLSTDRAMIRACPVTWPWNLVGWPSINVPAGFTYGGLPIGVQLMGTANSEPLLISLAAELEALNGWVMRQPDVWWDRRERVPARSWFQAAVENLAAEEPVRDDGRVISTRRDSQRYAHRMGMRAVPVVAVVGAAGAGTPAANADNKRLNDRVVANVYTIQHQAGCTNDVKINLKLQLAGRVACQRRAEQSRARR